MIESVLNLDNTYQLLKNLHKRCCLRNIFQFIGQIIPNLRRAKSERPLTSSRLQVGIVKLFIIASLTSMHLASESLRNLLHKSSGASY